MTKLFIFYSAVFMVIVASVYILGQNNPPAQPLPDTATIACPFGDNYTLSRGSDATLTVKCIHK